MDRQNRPKWHPQSYRHIRAFPKLHHQRESTTDEQITNRPQFNPPQLDVYLESFPQLPAQFYSRQAPTPIEINHEDIAFRKTLVLMLAVVNFFTNMMLWRAQTSFKIIIFLQLLVIGVLVFSLASDLREKITKRILLIILLIALLILPVLFVIFEKYHTVLEVHSLRWLMPLIALILLIIAILYVDKEEDMQINDEENELSSDDDQESDSDNDSGISMI